MKTLQDTSYTTDLGTILRIEKQIRSIVHVILIVLTAFFFCSLLSGCSTWRKLDRTERGAVVGGGTGAVLGGASGSSGGALLGGAAGAVAGGVIGHATEDEHDG